MFLTVLAGIYSFVRLNQKLSDALRSQTESAGGADGTKNEDDAVLNNLQHQLAMALRVKLIDLTCCQKPMCN
jgi:hypothetical protein